MYLQSAPCAHLHVGVFVEQDCGKRLQMWWRPTLTEYSACGCGAIAWLRAARTHGFGAGLVQI